MYVEKPIDRLRNHLKPCPFCGGKADITKFYNGFSEWYTVQCFNCHVSQTGNSYHSVERAVEEWNKRADESEKKETVSTSEASSYDCQSY